MSLPADDEPLPQDLSPEETGAALRAFHVQAAALGVYWAASMPGSLVLVGYALRYVGFSKESVGLVSGLVYGAGLLQIFSFLCMNKVRRKRAALLAFGLLEVALLAAVLLVCRPHGPVLPPGARRALFLAAVTASAAGAQMVAPLMSNWLSLVIPESRRGRYLGTRFLVLGLVQTLAGYGVGEFLTRHHETYAAYATLIGAACVCGALAYVTVARAPMPALAAEDSFHLGDVAACLRHAPFRRYLLFVLAANAAFAFACPYYAAFFLREVGLTPALVARYGLAYGVVRLVALKPAGRAVDRWGARPMVKVMLGIYAAFFFSFLFLTGDRYPLIFGVWAFVGMGDAIYGVAVPSMLFHAVPAGRSRSSFFALERSLTLLLLAAGPFLAIAYFSAMGERAFAAGGLHVEKFRLMYAFCGLLALAGLPLVNGLPDTHDVRLRGLVLGLFRANPFTALWRRFWKPPA